MTIELYFKLTQFYQDYAASIDLEEWDSWFNMFTDDCIYKIQSRENYDRDLPMAALSLEGKGMLKDRIYGVTETIFHDPYMQKHVVSAPRVISSSEESIDAQANYAVFRTKNDGIAEVFNVGRYVDRFVIDGDSLVLQSRVCVFDNDMILNSLIYPI